MINFILSLQFIFRPSYWVMLKPYSKELDCIINCLLDKHDFTEINQYTAKLGDYTIWIENIPYSCINLYEAGQLDNCRPSRLTIKRALDRLGNRIITEESIIKEGLQKIQNEVCHK